MAGPIAYYEVRWRLTSSTGEWKTMTLPPDSTSVNITGVKASESYRIEARSVGPSGLKSIWVDISHTVAGNLVPETPKRVVATGTVDSVRLDWGFDYPTPADLQVCVERATSASGPWNEVSRVGGLYAIITEKVDGTFYYRLRTVTYKGEFSGYSALASGNPATLTEINLGISEALQTAQNAQAAADGVIDTFWQANPPASGKLGDVWYDTDDGNKIYRWTGSSWLYSPDDRIATAISLANTAKTTADGKVKMFVGSNAPTSGMALHDLWFNDSSKTTLRWNGSMWDVLADQTSAALDVLVLNGGFEQGLANWTAEHPANCYVEASGNAALSGTKGLVFAPGVAGGAQRAYQTKATPCQPGQQITASATIRNLGNGANGETWLEVLCYDVNGQLLASLSKSYYQAAKNGTSEWRTVTKKFTIPAGCVSVRIGLITIQHTSGYWCVDSVRAAFTEAQPVLAAVGDNLVPNGNWGTDTLNFGLKSAAVAPKGTKIVDGWEVGTNNATSYHGSILVGTETGQSGQGRQLFIGDQGGTIPTGYTSTIIAVEDMIPVKAGWVLTVQCTGQVDKASGYIVNCPYYTYGGYWMFDIGGNNIGYQGMILTNHTGGWNHEASYTLPAACAFIKPVIGLDINNVTGAPAGVGVAVHHGRWSNLRIVRQMTLDEQQIAHGATYGKVANIDLYDYGTVRRVGLNVKGSRIILGGARNSRASLVGGVSSVRSTTSLSATSAGNVSVNAHTLELNGEAVSYNAVTNAVVGLSPGTTYVIFTIDPYLDGGTRTYYAQTSILSAQQAGDGCVFIGNIKIPTSGTGGGGGGGGVPPEEWCVDWDTVLPDGRFVRDLHTGDLVECIDVRSGETEMCPLLSMGIGEEECYRLVTPELHSVVQSKSTPMDLPDGRVCNTAEMFGKAVWVPGKTSIVSDLEYVGTRKVLKPNFGDKMFFAGERADRCIATHNGTYKP